MTTELFSIILQVGKANRVQVSRPTLQLVGSPTLAGKPSAIKPLGRFLRLSVRSLGVFSAMKKSPRLRDEGRGDVLRRHASRQMRPASATLNSTIWRKQTR